MEIKNKIITFVTQTNFKKYTLNTLWLFVEKIVRMIVGLTIGIWVANYLGPKDFGSLSYAQSFVGLFVAAALLGFDRIVVRKLVTHENNRDKILCTVFMLRIVALFVFMILIFTSQLIFINDNLTIYIILILSTSIFFQSFNILDYHFHSVIQSRYVALGNLISILFSILTKITLIYYQFPLIFFAYSLSFDYFIISISLIYFYFHHNRSVYTWEFDKEIAIIFMKLCWPLILSGLVLATYMKIDQIMIKSILGANAVGHYAAAAKISETWHFIPKLIIASLFPSIIKAKLEGKAAFEKKLQYLYGFMIWMAISATILTVLISEPLISFLYTKEFNQTAKILNVHVCASFFVFIGAIYNAYLLAENKICNILYSNLVGALANVILNLSLLKNTVPLGQRLRQL